MVRAREKVEFNASESSDPDGDPLLFEWIWYHKCPVNG
jgi:hypothetical protein